MASNGMACEVKCSGAAQTLSLACKMGAVQKRGELAKGEEER